MSTYIVKAQELYITEVLISADSPSEARQKVIFGEGLYQGAYRVGNYKSDEWEVADISCKGGKQNVSRP